MAGQIKALGFNCSLKTSKNKEKSSTDVLLGQFMAALATHDVTTEVLRAADYDIKPGVTHDEGKGDEWPKLAKKLRAAEIIVIGSPIWLGQPSSVAKRVLERMDAFLGDKDDHGRMPTYGKVGVCIAVGNEDGAHHVSAEVCQAMFEVGVTIPAGGATYWVGEALGSVDYKDLKAPPKAVTKWTEMLASNTAHLARILKEQHYPGLKGGR
jgi:multimeric flavodoxin WrbA